MALRRGADHWGRALRAPFPWIVLVLSVAISLFATWMTRKEVAEANAQRFQRQVDQLGAAIHSRLEAYVGMLRGGVGLFAGSTLVTREDWHHYVNALNLDKHFPGVQGFGYSEIVLPEARIVHEQEIRAEGFPEYHIYPQGQRSLYTTILFLEPFDWRNQRAFGFDMYSEPVRRAAMQRAAETGEASASGKVYLVQETARDRQAGFLIYLPVFKPQTPGAQLNPEGAPPPETESTPETDRRFSPPPLGGLQGFVYSPFRMKDLMTGIAPNQQDYIHFRVFDDRIQDDRILYDSALSAAPSDEPSPQSTAEQATLRGPHYHRTTELDVAGRRWLLQVESTPAFEQAYVDTRTLLVLSAGLTDSALLFLMTLVLISKRQSAERHADSLKEQLDFQAKLNHMANATSTALLTLDDGGRVEFYNASAEQCFGPRLWPGAAIFEVLPTLPLDALQNLENATVFDLQHTDPEGRRRELQVTLARLSLEADIALVCSVVDITDLKHNEQLLQQKTRELEQFVYAVSHDLRAPLVSLKGFGQLLRRSETLKSEPKSVHYIHRILANVESMDRLLQDLLTLSRIGHRPVARERIDLAALLREIMAHHSQELQRLGVTLQLPEQLPELAGQRSLIYQLFANLLSNALKYRKSDHPLVIRLEKLAETSERVRFGFSDNGIGIDARYHERIFNLFERLEFERSEGSGVGLTLCKAVVEKHGGTIHVESVVGQGSTFVFDLPRYA